MFQKHNTHIYYKKQLLQKHNTEIYYKKQLLQKHNTEIYYKKQPVAETQYARLLKAFTQKHQANGGLAALTGAQNVRSPKMKRTYLVNWLFPFKTCRFNNTF